MTTPPDTNKMRDLIQWPVVALAFIGCATVFALAFWAKQDLLAIASFITSIASIFIGVYLRQVSKDTNGNLAKRDAQIAELQRRYDELHNVRTIEAAQLAKQVPASASLPPSLAPDPYASASDAFTASTVSVPTVQRT